MIGRGLAREFPRRVDPFVDEHLIFVGADLLQTLGVEPRPVHAFRAEMMPGLETFAKLRSPNLRRGTFLLKARPSKAQHWNCGRQASAHRVGQRTDFIEQLPTPRTVQTQASLAPEAKTGG